jgi:hypothetical protein
VQRLTPGNIRWSPSRDAKVARRGAAAVLARPARHIVKESRTIPEAEFFTMPAEMTFMNRLQFGFYSLMARLDVTVDYAAIQREILATVPE